MSIEIDLSKLKVMKEKNDAFLASTGQFAKILSHIHNLYEDGFFTGNNVVLIEVKELSTGNVEIVVEKK